MWHRIKRNEKERTPTHIATLVVAPGGPIPGGSRASGVSEQCAWDLQIAQRRPGALSHPRGLCGEGAAVFWDRLAGELQVKKTLLIIAADLVPALDVLGLQEQMTAGAWDLDRARAPAPGIDGRASKERPFRLAVLTDPPVILALIHVATGRRVVLCDIANWLPQNARDHSAALSAPLEPDPRDNSIGAARCRRVRKVAVRLMRDVVDLVDFVAVNKLGNFARTAAGQAWNYWRHAHLPVVTSCSESYDASGNTVYAVKKKPSVVFHDVADVKKLERAAYIGGRIEPFFLGRLDEPVGYADVRSMYGYIMAERLQPVRLMRWELREGLLELPPRIDPAASIAAVEIDSPETAWPLRRAGRVIWAKGRLVTTLAGPELAAAVGAGLVKRWGSWAEYELGRPLQSVARALMELRLACIKDDLPVWSELCKQMLVSLYGKFAQRSARWVDVPGEHAEQPWSQWSSWDAVTRRWTRYRSIAWHVQREEEPQEIAHSFPAISAFVASAARRHMDRLREIAGARDVLYQGVDALILTRAGWRRLRDSPGAVGPDPGQLRLQAASPDCEITGCGQYTIGQRTVRAGLPRGAELAEDGSYTFARWNRAGNWFAGAPLDYGEPHTGRWHPAQSLPKGHLGHDGWIHPLVLPRDEPMIDQLARKK